MVQRRTPGLAQMGDAAAHWVDLLLRCPLCDKAKHESLVPHRGLPIPGQWQQRGPPAQPIGRSIAPVARENVPSVLGPAHLPAICCSSGTLYRDGCQDGTHACFSCG